jgi:hypothetical protein
MVGDRLQRAPLNGRKIGEAGWTFRRDYVLCDALVDDSALWRLRLCGQQ